MIPIACVKTGTKYSDEYVIRLKNGVERFASAPVSFTCFTDRPVEGVACRPLPADLPGWWAKLGLFKLNEPLLYLDLDVVITGDITKAWDVQEFTTLKDWWLPGFNSSVMRLTGHEGHVWENFRPDFIPRLRHGDQQWVTEQIPNAATYDGTLFPSFKASQFPRLVPNDSVAVIFHGRPKPDECGGWVRDYWK